MFWHFPSSTLCMFSVWLGIPDSLTFHQAFYLKPTMFTEYIILLSFISVFFRLIRIVLAIRNAHSWLKIKQVVISNLKNKQSFWYLFLILVYTSHFLPSYLDWCLFCMSECPIYMCMCDIFSDNTSKSLSLLNLFL